MPPWLPVHDHEPKQSSKHTAEPFAEIITNDLTLPIPHCLRHPLNCNGCKFFSPLRKMAPADKVGGGHLLFDRLQRLVILVLINHHLLSLLKSKH
jgi:hypothetical protein